MKPDQARQFLEQALLERVTAHVKNLLAAHD